LANFALNKLEKDFKTYIDKRMALCALYCDPMGLNHIGDLSDFCTMEEVFILSLNYFVVENILKPKIPSFRERGGGFLPLPPATALILGISAKILMRIPYSTIANSID